MVTLGKKLSDSHPVLKKATWIVQNALHSLSNIECADIVIASYSFNEIDEKEKEKEKFLKFIWEKTNKFLVIIDPGTPLAFSSIHAARNWFIENGVHIVSPCAHNLDCPAFKEQDWCHFYTRVQRTPVHKLLKNGGKGYEDEKFSYLILSKTPAPSQYESRIVRHPAINSGHLKLELCNKNGFETATYSKKKRRNI